MAEFDNSKLEMFLGVIRKYMQVRGPMSQKELAELSEVGVSTMSRFLSKKTTELNPQLIAKIIATLNIPLYEMIDFVEEEYSDRFVRLVKFYRDEGGGGLDQGQEERPFIGREEEEEDDRLSDNLEKTLSGPSGQTGTSRKNINAHFSSGGKKQTMSFSPDGGSRMDHIGDKIRELSPRQKAYVVDFLNLDIEGRDLMVDLGNNLFRYFKQKGMDL